ncbi:FAD-dependent monooxygenase [Actinomadura rugatobispora]|uniref:FAD-dependent monooxygenase n=1 Tax=Actinomadura rugatobispora TaxID=1994 RepID=A0ABW1A2B3_9ACTN|nr:FAD-dependent monooxygenase [Actinomadura rugatobispora]
MDASVIVIGAGPAGLMLAGELRLAGVDVIVLDRLGERTGQSRAIGFTIRTMEVFDQRGLLPRFGEIQTSFAGHFGGLPLDLGLLGSAHGAARNIPQTVTEAVLESWARQLGADVRRGWECTGFVEDAAGVTVTSLDGRALRCRYLVGCDGGHSTVRRTGGFDFPGTPATIELFLADIRGVELEPRLAGAGTDTGMAMVAPLPGGVRRIIVGERGTPPQRRTGPPEFSEVADVWKRVVGSDISMAEPVWVSAFGDAARLVAQYRRGRVLLAGDAAHVHLPAGGQGMNTGIQDAVNLGWKLAAVVRGRAPETLLDTYHDERHEVGRALLSNTRAQSTVLLGGEEAEPLRDVLGDLLASTDAQRMLAARVSGLDITYDVGGGRHPLLGARIPPLRLEHAGRSTDAGELLRTGRGVLLDLAGNRILRRRARDWADRVDIVTATPRADGTSGALEDTTALLLRPDGHVAWAAPGTDDDLRTALNRWFGPSR